MRPPTALDRPDSGRLLSVRGEAAAGQPLSQEHDRQTLSFPEVRANVQMSFDASLLRDVRRLVAKEAQLAQLSKGRREDLVLAIDELATNSVTHGGGSGTLKVWRGQHTIACEVCDCGHIEDPLVGLRPPRPEQISGRGLWVVSRLCDCVHISSSPGGTAVRVQMATP